MGNMNSFRPVGLAFASCTLALMPGLGCHGKATGTNLKTDPHAVQDGTAPAAVGDQGPAMMVLPSLKSAPAPSWLKRGARLTYFVQTATVKGTGADWKPDENGIWKTEDGRRWSPGEKPEGAAAGLLQFDVTELRPDHAVILASFYLIPKAGAAPTLSFQYPLVGPVSNAGGLWITPTELKKLKNTVTSRFKVQRMPIKLGDKSRNAVWIQSFTERGSQIFAYDEETGMLLHDSTKVEGAPSLATEKSEVSNTPSVALSNGSIAGARVVAYPWSGGDATEWAAQATPLSYEGTSLVPTATAVPLKLNVSLRAEPKTHGPGWVHYGMVLHVTNTGNMPPITTPSETVTGLGQFGGAWLPPATLATLTQGQKLDTDPLTKVSVTVTSVSAGQVVMTASSPMQVTRWGYDKRTGLLSSIEKDDRNPLGAIRTKMTLVEDE